MDGQQAVLQVKYLWSRTRDTVFMPCAQRRIFSSVMRASRAETSVALSWQRIDILNGMSGGFTSSISFFFRHFPTKT